MDSLWNGTICVSLLAVFREGTLSGAARRLGVTHSTVFRRLGAIEEQIGVRLFERFRDGYVPTPAGETAAATAARLEDEVLTLERRLSGQDLRPSGVVRITTTDTLGTILMRHLPAMRAVHPEIQFEVAISNAMANLTRREAEIAIRPNPEPPEILVGRRIADIAHAIYGSRSIPVPERRERPAGSRLDRTGRCAGEHSDRPVDSREPARGAYHLPRRRASRSARRDARGPWASPCFPVTWATSRPAFAVSRRRR